MGPRRRGGQTQRPPPRGPGTFERPQIAHLIQRRRLWICRERAGYPDPAKRGGRPQRPSQLGHPIQTVSILWGEVWKDWGIRQ
jgi:hypothetical protein